MTARVLAPILVALSAGGLAQGGRPTEAYRVNGYVLHGKGDPKALLNGMYFWTWNTEEVLAMIEWMRRFNASGKGRMQFTGFDMQTARVAIETVARLLGQVDPAYAEQASRIYQGADALSPARVGFGVATGSFPVNAVAGRKIRFSGAIRTASLDGFAGLWWRADGPDGVLVFDNMQARAPKGTTEWTRHEIVLDIPRETINVNFGVLMPGTGTAWFDDLRLEIDGKPYDDTSLFDFDFESGQIKGFSTPAPEYTARVDESTASHGTRSLRLQSSSDDVGRPAPANSPAEASRSFAGVVAHMETSRDAYTRQAGAPEVEWAIQNARVVHQYAQMLAGEVSRDESMARNVKWVLDTAPKGTRVVLWAHNGHVGRIRQGAYRAMGAYLHDWYGKHHVVVGFTLNRGEYTAITQGTGLGRHPLAPAPTRLVRAHLRPCRKAEVHHRPAHLRARRSGLGMGARADVSALDWGAGGRGAVPSSQPGGAVRSGRVPRRDHSHPRALESALALSARVLLPDVGRLGYASRSLVIGPAEYSSVGPV